jgi:hypothetical protein
MRKNVHLASLREPRLEEFPVGGGRNKLKVRLGIRNLAAIPVLWLPTALPTTAVGRPVRVPKADIRDVGFTGGNGSQAKVRGLFRVSLEVRDCTSAQAGAPFETRPSRKP